MGAVGFPSTPNDGDVFEEWTFDATKDLWELTPVASSGGGATTFGGLTDVSTTGVTDGQGIFYDNASGEWQPGGVAINSGTTNYAASRWNNTTSLWEETTDVILADSGVGIGIAAPLAKLHVEGNAIAKTQTASITGNTTLDFATNQNFILTLTGTVTLDAPTTEVVGQSGFIVFIQDATGSHAVALSSSYKTAGSSGITLSTAATSTDIIPYIVTASGSILLGAPQLAFG